MKLPDGDYTEFGTPISNKAYNDVYGSKIVGSRTKGSVHGVELTFEADESCDTAENLKTQMTVAIECSD